MPLRRLPLPAFLAATLVATVLACIVQTQVNLAAIIAMDVAVPPSVRLRTTLQDLLGFSRTMAPIAAATLLLALPVATWLARRLDAGRRWGRIALCALGAAVGFYVAIPLANAVASMPALIAATRGSAGMAAMAVAMAIGGAVFGWWGGATRPRPAVH